MRWDTVAYTEFRCVREMRNCVVTLFLYEENEKKKENENKEKTQGVDDVRQPPQTL